MSRRPTDDRDRGFALVITLALLALLVLGLFALSALVKVGGEVAHAGFHQSRAKQNALMALDVALSELQKAAGDDTRITATAGMTGVGPGAANSTRHWCGVWRADGSFVGWLTSGASASSATLGTGVPTVEVVSTGSVGAAASNSEHVIAGKQPVTPASAPASPDAPSVIGYYAYAVLDEGVKIPLYAPAPTPVVAPMIFSNATNAASRMRDAVANNSSVLPSLRSYEQVRWLPTGTELAVATVQDNFHHVSFSPRAFNGSALQPGYVNPNTDSAQVWRSLLETYNAIPGIPATLTDANINAYGTTAQNTVASFASGQKFTNGPFLARAAVRDFLGTLIPASSSPTAAEVYAALEPMISLRSDTFRIRTYGESVDPSGLVESRFFAEATVQRIADPAPNGLGRTFVQTSFRWLGPDDI